MNAELQQHECQRLAVGPRTPNSANEQPLELEVVVEPGHGIPAAELGEAALTTAARRHVAHGQDVAQRAAVVRHPPSRDRDVDSLAVPAAERQLSFELPAALEIFVPGLELVPKLGGPERKRLSFTHELRALESEQLAQAAVDRTDSAVLDEHQPVGDRRQELTRGRELGVLPANDDATRGAAEPVGERGCTGDAERRGSSEDRSDVDQHCLSGGDAGDRDAGDGRGEEQQLLFRPRHRRFAHAVPALTFRSNLCHARSPRRKRHVPLSRAQAIIGR